jgi:hypothetical protein
MLKQKANGFTLVEVMIAAAALAALGLVVMNMTKITSKSSLKYQVDSEVNLITNELIAKLSNPATCFAALGGKNAQSTLAGISSINNQYYISTHPAAPSNGYGNASLKINSYQIIATAAEVAGNNSNLIIAFQNKNLLKGTAGPAMISRRIKFYVEVVGANISKCYSLANHTADIWTRGGGVNIFYNGNVGIGTVNPLSKLEVAGSIKPGGASMGAFCAGHPEGAMAYDTVIHTPVYCSNTGKWQAMGGNGFIVYGANPNCVIGQAVSRRWTTVSCTDATGNIGILKTGWGGGAGSPPVAEACQDWEKCHLCFADTWDAVLCQ